VSKISEYFYKPLPKPVPISDQFWPDETIPLVHTRTMTYMHESFIKECIEGILMQKTTFPVQVLIHDDASTDKTAEIVRSYQKKYPNLIKAYFQQENTFKKPDKLERQKEFRSWRIGKYEALCEGDDYWTDSLKLQKQVEFLESNPKYAMCFHKAKIISPDYPERARYYDHVVPGDYSGKEILLKWTVPTGAVVFKNHIIKNYKDLFHPDYLYGDIILFLTLAEHGKVHCLPGEMSVYRIHKGGVTLNKPNDFTLKFINHHKAIQRNFNGKYRHVTDGMIASYYQGLSINEQKKGKLLQGIRYMINFWSYRIQHIIFNKIL